MFNRFLSIFDVQLPKGPSRAWVPKGIEATGFAELMGGAAGGRFEGGLYRLHDATSATAANELLRAAFPELARRANCFGCDWLGRQFALDYRRLNGREPLVLMAEPGTGEVLEIPATFSSFHDDELVEFGEEALARSFFEQWSVDNAQLLPLAASQCVGYRVPLFLGGMDTVDNLELIDLDVYWTLCGQLRHGVRRMKPGATIKWLTLD